MPNKGTRQQKMAKAKLFQQPGTAGRSLSLLLDALHRFFATIQSAFEPYTARIAQKQSSAGAKHAMAMGITVAIAFPFMAAAMRLLFFQNLGTSVPYVTFFPAVMLAAIYGGFWSGLAATLVATLLVDYHWIEPVGQIGFRSSADLTGMGFFILDGIIVSLITKYLHKARGQAKTAKIEADYALELKRAAEKLHESETHYKAMIDAYDGMVYICSPDYRIEFMNDKLLKRTGHDATGELCYQALHGLDSACAWCVNDRVRSGENVRWELKSPKDGRWYEVSNTPIRNIDGSISKQAMITDITERKQTEEALLRAHAELEQRVRERTSELENTVEELHQQEHLLLQQGRLAAMGETVNNIAHQWRQPLNNLGLIIQSLELCYEVGEFNRELVRKTVNDSMQLILHMSQTIDDFRNFFKPLKDKEHFQVCTAINNAVKLAGASFTNNNIEVTQDFSCDATVYGYPNEYAQVILNLLSNARDAFEKNGVSRPVVVIGSTIAEGRSIVTVNDNAGGIPLDIIGKIFEPHFTTKGVQGTGIGLFMSKNIIEKNMGGTLRASNAGNGAQLEISLRLSRTGTDPGQANP